MVFIGDAPDQLRIINLRRAPMFPRALHQDPLPVGEGLHSGDELFAAMHKDVITPATILRQDSDTIRQVFAGGQGV
jgi:hypothetical protein